MADLLTGQYELDGYLFGLASDEVSVLSDGWDPGSYDIDNQDADNPIGDNTWFGRDYFKPGSVTLTMLVHHDENCRPALTRLANAWRADHIRKTPGAESVLRYNSFGETRRVYGRPRRFAVEKQPINDPTYRVVTADFKLSEYVSYGDSTNLVTMDLITTPIGGGVTLPAVLPWTLGASESTARRGIVTIGGAPAPFIATFYGPITGTANNWRLQTANWVFTSNASLRPGETLTLDTRKGTLTHSSGASAVGSIGRSSLTPRLPTGTSEILFGAADSTATAYATVQWFPIDPIL